MYAAWGNRHRQLSELVAIGRESWMLEVRGRHESGFRGNVNPTCRKYVWNGCLQWLEICQEKGRSSALLVLSNKHNDQHILDIAI